MLHHFNVKDIAAWLAHPECANSVDEFVEPGKDERGGKLPLMNCFTLLVVGFELSLVLLVAAAERVESLQRFGDFRYDLLQLSSEQVTRGSQERVRL